MMALMTNTMAASVTTARTRLAGCADILLARRRSLPDLDEIDGECRDHQEKCAYDDERAEVIGPVGVRVVQQRGETSEIWLDIERRAA